MVSIMSILKKLDSAGYGDAACNPDIQEAGDEGLRSFRELSDRKYSEKYEWLAETGEGRGHRGWGLDNEDNVTSTGRIYLEFFIQ